MAGGAVLQALNSAAEALDPGGVTALAVIYAKAAAGVEEDGGRERQHAAGEAATIGGGDDRAKGEDEGGGGTGGLEGLLASLPAPSPQAQSVLVDLGRTALKVKCSSSCSEIFNKISAVYVRPVK